MTFLALLSLLTFGENALSDYVKVLPTTLERAIPVDPAKGYAIQQVKPDIFVLTDGIWQSAAVVGPAGVVLIDAPESFGSHIIQAIREVTGKPIVSLIYSHTHLDHIGGSHYLSEIQNLEVIALEDVATFLREKKDARRLLPTRTFKHDLVLPLGKMNIHLSTYHYHSPEGDLLISIPEQKFLMVIDVLAPGYVPFKNLDLCTNVYEYLKVFDTILTYNFDVFVGGHLTSVGNREDVLISKAYVQDVYETVKRIHSQTDMIAVMAAAAQEVGWENKFLLFKVFLDQIIEQSSKELNSRWKDRLAGVDVWSSSHAAKMLEYVRWDD